MALFLVFAAKSFIKPKKYNNTIFQQFYAEDCFLHIFFYQKHFNCGVIKQISKNLEESMDVFYETNRIV